MATVVAERRADRAADDRRIAAVLQRHHAHGRAFDRCDRAPSGRAAQAERAVGEVDQLGVEPHYPSGLAARERPTERMHRTLKAQTTRPPAANAAEQQARLTPSAGTQPGAPTRSAGPTSPDELYVHAATHADRVETWYDADHQVRRERPSGEIMWKGGRLYVSEVLAGELLGIAELETGDHVGASTTAIWGSSIAVAGSPGRSAPHGTARTGRTAANSNCRISSRSKVSTINPVEPVGGHASRYSNYPPPPTLPHKGEGSRPSLPPDRCIAIRIRALIASRS